MCSTVDEPSTLKQLDGVLQAGIVAVQWSTVLVVVGTCSDAVQRTETVHGLKTRITDSMISAAAGAILERECSATNKRLGSND